jgi:hypothetical protein
VVRTSSGDAEPSVASRILVGKMLISSPPSFGGEERGPSPRHYTQRGIRSHQAANVRLVARISKRAEGGTHRPCAYSRRVSTQKIGVRQPIAQKRIRVGPGYEDFYEKALFVKVDVATAVW